jgi:hypothetical protein
MIAGVRKEYEVIESATKRVIVLDEAEDDDDWEEVDNREPSLPRREYAAVVRGS